MNDNIITLEMARPGERLGLDNGNPRPNEICLANESRFNSAFFSKPLTDYAVGWVDQNDLEGLLDFLFPPVQVGRRFEFKKCDASEEFLADTDDARGIGAEFKRVEYRGTTVNEKTINRGLTMRVDLDQLGEMPRWREVHLNRLLQRLLRNELRRAMTLLTGSATNTAKTWDTTAGKDPDQDILSELVAGIDESGVRPNRIVFGEVAWNKRLLAHRAQASAGGYASAGLTPAELANFLGVEGARISRERYQATLSGKAKLLGDVVLLYFGQNDPGTEDPSHGKRFWTATEGGGKYRVYENQVNSKTIDLTVEHYSSLVVTSTLGLRKLTIS